MPDSRNYYVLCDDNCRFPSMTYEQIIAAIAEATGNTPTHVEDAFITKVQESNHSGNLTFWKGTQAEFNALSVTTVRYKVDIDANGKLYFTPYEAEQIVTSMIADGAVTTEKIANDAVTENKIADDAVTEDKIADNSVTGNKLRNYSIKTAKLDNQCVTNAKIAVDTISKDLFTPELRAELGI